MNKKIWTHYNPQLLCPNCSVGFLGDYKKNHRSETLASLKNNEYHKNGLACPETVYLGTSHLKCNKCSDVVIMTYILKQDVRDTDDNGNEVPFYIPLSYYPPPKIIHIPNSCTKEISDILNQSFILFWVDLGSCANKIRIAIEVMMNHFNINDQISLHCRITEFSRINPKVSKYLLAIKWIGNSGSHYSFVTKKAIIDAYELLEYSLEILFNDREKNLDDLSLRINVAKKHE